MRKKKGRLFVLEGSDGAGKSTQFAQLCARLTQEGQAHRRLVFPRYEEDSSALIRMYLRGDFGQNPREVNPYAATAFYAVDRYASYIQDWKEDYAKGTLCLSDRYTTSNAIHQAAKLQGAARRAYLSWLHDFEYIHMGLPAPDLVLYLDLPTELALKRIRARAKIGDGQDIHESDADYLAACRAAALEVAAQEGWHLISCLDDTGSPRTVPDLHGELWQALLPYLD